MYDALFAFSSEQKRRNLFVEILKLGVQFFNLIAEQNVAFSRIRVLAIEGQRAVCVVLWYLWTLFWCVCQSSRCGSKDVVSNVVQNQSFYTRLCFTAIETLWNSLFFCERKWSAQQHERAAILLHKTFIYDLSHATAWNSATNSSNKTPYRNLVFLWYTSSTFLSSRHNPALLWCTSFFVWIKTWRGLFGTRDVSFSSRRSWSCSQSEGRERKIKILTTLDHKATTRKRLGLSTTFSVHSGLKSAWPQRLPTP